MRKIIARTAQLIFCIVAFALQDAAWADSSKLASTMTGEIDTSDIPVTLCEPEEVIVFSCALPKKKTVSLCASKDASDNTGYMQYRLGRNVSSIELEYPRKKAPAKDFFKHYTFAFSKGGTAAVSFWIGIYRYSLYNTSSSFGYNGAGVIVNRGKNTIRAAFLKCTSTPIKSAEVTWITPFATDERIGYFERLGLPDAGDDISYDGPEPGPEPGSRFYRPKLGEPENWRVRTEQ